MNHATRYVKPEKFFELTGYTVDAVRGKCGAGVWREGREYIIAPDGNRLIDLRGYERWAESRQRAE